MTITEGRFHQVKRMFAAVGNRVTGLHREQIGNIRLNVPVGQWRALTRMRWPGPDMAKGYAQSLHACTNPDNMMVSFPYQLIPGVSHAH
ncbi:hypothetical protein MBH78_05140 [Oceanimonas sp. NS1]|nr:hypothetical protein [Oceanimonas sp. NS1]